MLFRSLLVRKAAQVEMPDRKGRIVQQVGKIRGHDQLPSDQTADPFDAAGQVDVRADYREVQPVSRADVSVRNLPVVQGYTGTQSEDAIRLYSDREIESLGETSVGFVTFLESAGVLPPPMREMVIDRAMAAGGNPLDLDDMKIIILMVFWSLGEEPDALILDELFVAPEERLIH